MIKKIFLLLLVIFPAFSMGGVGESSLTCKVEDDARGSPAIDIRFDAGNNVSGLTYTADRAMGSCYIDINASEKGLIWRRSSSGVTKVIIKDDDPEDMPQGPDIVIIKDSEEYVYLDFTSGHWFRYCGASIDPPRHVLVNKITKKCKFY